MVDRTCEADDSPELRCSGVPDVHLTAPGGGDVVFVGAHGYMVIDFPAFDYRRGPVVLGGIPYDLPVGVGCDQLAGISGVGGGRYGRDSLLFLVQDERVGTLDPLDLGENAVAVPVGDDEHVPAVAVGHGYGRARGVDMEALHAVVVDGTVHEVVQCALVAFVDDAESSEADIFILSVNGECGPLRNLCAEWCGDGERGHREK